MYTFIIFLLLGCKTKDEKAKKNLTPEISISLDTLSQKDEKNRKLLEVILTNTSDYDIFLPGYLGTYSNLYLRLELPDTSYIYTANFFFHQQIIRDTATSYNRHDKNIQKLSDSLKSQLFASQTLSENDSMLVDRRTFFACTLMLFLKKKSSYKTSYKLDFLNELDSLAKVNFPKRKPKYEIFFVYNPQKEKLKDILHVETSVDLPNKVGSYRKAVQPILSDTLTFNK